MRFATKQITGLAIAALLSLAMVGPARAATSDSGTVTITTTVDATLTVTVLPDSLTIPGDLFTCNAASTSVVVTIFSNAPYTGTIDAAASGPISVSSLWRDSVGALDCGQTSGVNFASGTNGWIGDPAPATDADGENYLQYYSLNLGYAGMGTTTFTLTYSATQ